MTSSAASSAAMPSSTSASLTVHGGTKCTRLKCMNGHTPARAHRARDLGHRLRRRRPTRCRARAVRGSCGCAPARPPRTRRARAPRRPTDARRELAQLRADRRPRRSRRACSMIPSSSKILIDATADAHASGWPEYVRPPGNGWRANVSAIALRDDHAAERHVAGVHALRERDEVGRDIPAIDREPLAAPAEAGHHLVGDHHDAELVADRADAREVAVGRHEDAVRADDRSRG